MVPVSDSHVADPPSVLAQGTGASEQAESPVGPLLGAQQRALMARIAAANSPGNLDGLFAFHVIAGDPALPLTWQVNSATPDWFAANRARLAHTPTLAATGYALHHFGGTAPVELWTAFAEGLAKLHLPNPFPVDRVSFTYRPIDFLGLTLGALALGDRGADHRAWLTKVLADPRRGEPTKFHALLYGYISYLLVNEPMAIDDARRFAGTDELALLEWGIRRSALRLLDPYTDLSALQAQVLRASALADVEVLDPARAAVVWSAMHASLTRGIGEIVLSRSQIATVLRRFEDAMRRWRWDPSGTKVRQPIRWPVTSEREVQDIIWLILRSTVDDLVDEEALPKLGHSFYKPDFAIPSLRLLVEAKYARQAGDFRDIEKEILQDSVAYMVHTNGRYNRILVFIYDHSASVQEHGVTELALRQIPAIEDVIIVSRPSQLPLDNTEVAGPPE
jgi:REase_DpnII-MboI